MADWHFDPSQAPRDGRPVILATTCKKVIKSRWIAPDKKERRPVGRWELMATGQEPVAWQRWPAHPMPTVPVRSINEEIAIEVMDPFAEAEEGEY